MNTSFGGFGKLTAGGQRYFGAPIGVLLLDCYAPFIPGSVGNASTFSAPVRYRTVEDLSVDDIFSADAPAHAHKVVEAAQKLVAEGARMITANCGFTARYQKEVQAAVDVPVLLSSLLLVPFLQAMLPTGKKLGVLTASTKSLTPEFLAASNLSWAEEGVVFAGLDSAAAFGEAYMDCVGTADFPAIHDEVVSAARDLVAAEPTVGCLLLECSELPPYSASVQQATGLPVFDFTSMIEFYAAGLRRTPFSGHF